MFKATFNNYNSISVKKQRPSHRIIWLVVACVQLVPLLVVAWLAGVAGGVIELTEERSLLHGWVHEMAA